MVQGVDLSTGGKPQCTAPRLLQASYRDIFWELYRELVPGTFGFRAHRANRLDDKLRLVQLNPVAAGCCYGVFSLGG